LSNPSSQTDFLRGGIQNKGIDGPHFDLARPGAEADLKIKHLGETLIEEGVK